MGSPVPEDGVRDWFTPASGPHLPRQFPPPNWARDEANIAQAEAPSVPGWVPFSADCSAPYRDDDIY
jgi:hypothetical protein